MLSPRQKRTSPEHLPGTPRPGVGPSFDSRFAPESPFGYRLVTDKGFQFRIGIPPTFNYAKDSGISFGWSF